MAAGSGSACVCIGIGARFDARGARFVLQRLVENAIKHNADRRQASRSGCVLREGRRLEPGGGRRWPGFGSSPFEGTGVAQRLRRRWSCSMAGAPG